MRVTNENNYLRLSQQVLAEVTQESKCVNDILPEAEVTPLLESKFEEYYAKFGDKFLDYLEFDDAVEVGIKRMANCQGKLLIGNMFSFGKPLLNQAGSLTLIKIAKIGRCMERALLALEKLKALKMARICTRMCICSDRKKNFYANHAVIIIGIKIENLEKVNAEEDDDLFKVLNKIQHCIMLDPYLGFTDYIKNLDQHPEFKRYIEQLHLCKIEELFSCTQMGPVIAYSKLLANMAVHYCNEPISHSSPFEKFIQEKRKGKVEMVEIFFV